MALLTSRRVSPLTPTGLRNAAGHHLVVGSLLFVLRTIFRMSLADTRVLPMGPVIVAPNHRSFLDPAVVGAVLDRRPVFIMAGRYYDIPLMNWFFRMERCIAVDVDSDNRAALRAGKTVLDGGRVLVVFPEGHISRDGTQQPGQPGVAWLSAKTGAPVFPMYIGGTAEVLPRGSRVLRPARVSVLMGEPITMAGYPPGRLGQDQFTKDLMARIAELGERAPPP